MNQDKWLQHIRKDQQNLSKYMERKEFEINF